MDENSSNELAITSESLIADLQRLSEKPCSRCGGPVCFHQLLMSFALGFKELPRCLDCVSRLLGRNFEELCDALMNYIHHRECFRSAWEWADLQEAGQGKSGAGCEFSRQFEVLNSQTGAPAPSAKNQESNPFDRNSSNVDPRELISAQQWDAGEMGCGELVLELRQRLDAMRPGEVFRLTARDPGAPADLPAWCRLMGHELLESKSPFYWIKRKE